MVLKRVMKLGQEFLWFWNKSKIHSEEAIVALSSSSATWKKIWMGGRVFHTRTIRRVSTSCLAGIGNFFQWNNVNYGVKGKTAVVMPSPCGPQKWFHCETTVSSKWVASLSKGLRLNFSLVLLKWNFQRSGNFWLTVVSHSKYNGFKICNQLSFAFPFIGPFKAQIIYAVLSTDIVKKWNQLQPAPSRFRALHVACLPIGFRVGFVAAWSF